MLNAWERKILRSVYEPELSKRSGESDPTKNPRELHKPPDMIADNESRMEWLGHTIRIDQIVAKNSFESKSGVTRKMGRHILKWLKGVQYDLES
jgi:hypothetical protein